MAFYGVLKNANEWFYVRRLGKKRQFLPPGDMGWPFIGTQLSFLKAFKSNYPDSFISNFAARSLFLSFLLLSIISYQCNMLFSSRVPPPPLKNKLFHCGVVENVLVPYKHINVD